MCAVAGGLNCLMVRQEQQDGGVSDLTRRRGRRERREIKRRNALRLLSGAKGTEKSKILTHTDRKRD